MLVLQILLGVLIGLGAAYFLKIYKKTEPESQPLTDAQRSAKFQAHIQGQIAEIRRLQHQGADTSESQALIERFEAAGTLDRANLFLKNLISTSQKISDEKLRELEHKKLLEYAKEVERLNSKGFLEGGVGDSFLKLAQLQFRNEMLRIAGKTLKH